MPHLFLACLKEDALAVADEFIARARELQEGPGMLSEDVDYMAAKVQETFPPKTNRKVHARSICAGLANMKVIEFLQLTFCQFYPVAYFLVL